MSGIRVGTRLEQLLQLRDRLDHEIAAERRLEAFKVFRRPTHSDPRPALRAHDAGTTAMLEDLGVTALDVKRWAHDQGLIPGVVRGRVPHGLVKAYANAHREKATT